MVIGAIIGSAVVGAGVSAYSAHQAANTQANAANNATNAQLQMFNTQNAQQAPYRAAGVTALGQIAGGFGVGPSSGGIDSGYFNHQFNAADLGTNLDPSYGFRFGQGLGAATNVANRYGGGGNLIKGVTDYATGMAQSGYQQAYQNYTANQTNIYNRLASIAGLGQTAGSNQNTGASQFGSSIANTITGAGNAIASGQVGVGNAVSGSLNNAMGWYQLSNLMNPPASTPPSG